MALHRAQDRSGAASAPPVPPPFRRTTVRRPRDFATAKQKMVPEQGKVQYKKPGLLAKADEAVQREVRSAAATTAAQQQREVAAAAKAATISAQR